MTLEQRQHALQLILDAARFIAVNPQVRHYMPFIANYWQFFQRSASLSIPDAATSEERQNQESCDIDHGPLFNQMFDKSSAQPLSVVPLCADDQTKGMLWQYIWQHQSIGLYVPSEHQIIINMELPETPIFKAVILFHEIGHAWQAVQECRTHASARPRATAKRVRDEVKMLELEHAIVRGLCEQPAFDRELEKQIQASLPGRARIPVSRKQATDALLPYLCRALGDNPMLLQEREQMIAYCCLFTACDRQLSANYADQIKQAVIRKAWSK